MNIDYIVRTLNANALDYDRDFDHLIARGYDGNECQKLSEEIVECLGELVRRGVNGGFNRSMCSAVKELTKLACKLSKKGAEKNVFKFKQQKMRIEQDIRYPQEGDGTLSIKGLVYPAIDTSIGAAQVLIDRHVHEARASVLEKSIELLRRLREIVEGALDDSSQSALDRATEVMQSIINWRKVSEKLMFDETSLKFLEEAIKSAEAWHELCSTLRSRDKVKESDLNQVRFDFKNDRIGRVAESSDVLRKIDMLGDNIARYRFSKDAYYNTEKLEAELDAVHEKIKALKAEKDELAKEFMNGKADKSTVTRQGKRIDSKIEDLEETERDYEHDLDQRERGKQDYLRTARKLENVYEMVKRYEDEMDLGMLTTIGKAVNFDAIFSVMAGTGHSNDVDETLKVVRIEQTIDQNVAKLQAALHERMEKLEQENDAAWEKIGARPKVDREQREKEEDDYIAQLLKEHAAAEEEPEDESLDPVRSRLTEDDK